MKDIKNARTGRTFWDWLAENPITAIFLALVIVLISVSALYMNKPIKIGPLELNQTKVTVHDTIIEFKYDTNYSNLPVNRKKFNKIPPSLQKEITIKKGVDTLISVKNQPANINTGTNNGIIGNDNKISINSIPREFDQFQKNLLNERLKDKSAVIHVSAIAGDPEAFSFANKIFQYLKSNGYTNVDGVSQSMYTKPNFGQFLIPTKTGFEILIGTNPSNK